MSSDDDLEFFTEGETVFFRPKMYGYRTWVQGKIIDFCHSKRTGNDVAIMRPCGPGFGPTNSKNTYFCIDVPYLYKEQVKDADPRAGKTVDYTTRRKKGRRKKR